ncbi:putative RNA-directed DNA polymerase [Helianthus annuus]|nr:putative RNA-directed DNA polymerase [Helianthus annuus]
MVEPFLVSNSLFGYIDGSIPCPSPKVSADAAAADNPNYTRWIANDAHVRMLIISTVSEASFQHVQGTTSKDVWLSLERAYAPQTASHEYTLKTRLLKIAMKGDEKAVDYLTRAQEYATALANIGEPQKDKDVVMLTIAGLREEYNSLKGNLLARNPPVQFNELYGLLTDHDYMITKNQEPQPSLIPQAYNSTTKQPPTINNIQSQLQNLQLLAAQLGYQLQPTPNTNQPSPAFSPQPQAYFAPRSYNNNRGNRRGTYRGNSRANSNRGRDNSGNNRQFSWAATQNTVFGHCNRCGIGHLPTQCPNQAGPSRQPSQANFAAFSDTSSQYDVIWKPDTGANDHASPDLASLDNSEPYQGNDSLHVGDGTPLPIFHIGSSKIYTPHKTFNISNILHVPALKQNLLSVQKFCSDNDVFFEFHASFFVVKDESTRTILLTGPSEQGLYSIRLPTFKSLPKVAFTATKESSTIWHHRLGHPHLRVFQSLISSCSLPVSTKLSSCLCTSCQLGKSSKLSLKLSTFRSNNILDLVYCDVWGPSPTLSLDGYRFFLLCVDHHSRYMWFYPLAHKSDVYTTFKQFLHMVERQFNTKLKSVQTDWGGEFRNLTPFFNSLGIIHRRSCPHTSEQNGIVERRHRHVVETGLALLAHSNLPLRFWRFAFDTATYLINRLPSRVSSNMSPYQHVFKHKPDYSFLRVFGCQCFPYLRPYNRHKIDFRSTPCIFLGYSPDHHGYRCFDPVSERVYVARHVRFNEHILPSRTPPPPAPPPPSYTSIFPTPPPNLSNSENNPTSTVSSPNTNQPPSAPTPMPPQPADPVQPTPFDSSSEPGPAEPTTSAPNPPINATQSAQPDSPTRPRPAHLRPNPKRPNRYNPSAYYTTTSPDQLTEPTSFTVTNKSPEWSHAMNEEFHALNKNGTWSLVPYVDNSNVVDCKWVYRLKRDAQGKVTRYKARLVAKGFHQQAGVDYHETFSPVVKATTIRVVLSLAATHKWALRQLDVQNAFLHGDLQETVYMRQPQGFVDPSKPHHVCLLHKSLYGLKQAPRAWFHRLSTALQQLGSALQQLGFHGSKTDPSLFILNSRGTIIYVLVYVDDIIITGNNNQAVDHIIQSLSSSFAVKDLGSLHYFLGIEVIRHGLDLILSQKKYIWDTLQRSGLSDCKPVNSPMSTSQVLMPDDSPLMPDPTKYRQVVGALQYATLTRPDIAFSVNKVCQFMHAPTENHWTAVKRILRYLKGTTDLGLRIRHDSGSILHAFTDVHWTNSVQAYSDSDWAGCPVDRRSTGGFAIYLGSNLVSWIARKQRTVSRSSTESEYKALADTVAELIWLKALLRELGIAKNYSPTLWCDNLGATFLSANPVFHARTKHVEVDYHFVREQVAQGNLHVKFIATNDQIADVFTKPLSSQRFQFLRSKLQVVPRPQLAGGY